MCSHSHKACERGFNWLKYAIMASLVLDSFIRHRQVNESTSPLDVERLATKPRLIRACLALRTETKAHSPAPLNAFMLPSAASLWSRGCAIPPSIHPFIPPSFSLHSCTLAVIQHLHHHHQHQHQRPHSEPSSPHGALPA